MTGRSGFLEHGAPTRAEAVDPAEFSRSARMGLVYTYKFSMQPVTDAEKQLAATYLGGGRGVGGGAGAGAGAAVGLSPMLGATGATARKDVRGQSLVASALS